MVVKAPQAIAVTAQVRDRTAALRDRMGPVQVNADSGWEEFAVACGFDLSTPRVDATVVVVGAPASVRKHAANTTSDFGFVMPVAQIAAAWQRAPTWRTEATLDLWAQGWTPIAVDRIVVAERDVRLEIVIGNARRTPVG